VTPRARFDRNTLRSGVPSGASNLSTSTRTLEVDMKSVIWEGQKEGEGEGEEVGRKKRRKKKKKRKT
jgi:hypothetical protein